MDRCGRCQELQRVQRSMHRKKTPGHLCQSLTFQFPLCLLASLQKLYYIIIGIYLYIFVLLIVFLLYLPFKICRVSLTWRRKSGSKAASTALAKTGPPCCASATSSAALSPSLGTAPSWRHVKKHVHNVHNVQHVMSNMSHVMSHCSAMSFQHVAQHIPNSQTAIQISAT